MSNYFENSGKNNSDSEDDSESNNNSDIEDEDDDDNAGIVREDDDEEVDYEVDDDVDIDENVIVEPLLVNGLNPLTNENQENENSDVEDDDDEEEDENYLQKFDKDINKNYILDFHPECSIHNQTEIEALSHVTRNGQDIIIDDLHRTLPFLTKFERARILGQRAKQINSGSTAFVKIPDKVIDGYAIAEIELLQKAIPFIIRRPLTNGGSEYWKVQDLENISF